MDASSHGVPDRPGAFDGEIVVCRDGQQLQRTRGHFSGYVIGSTDSWIVVGELSGAPSWKILAYAPDQDTFATQTPTFPLARLVVLPSP